MPIVVRCPHCQKRLGVPGRFAGTIAACPQCQGQFQVPAAGADQQSSDDHDLGTAVHPLAPPTAGVTVFRDPVADHASAASVPRVAKVITANGAPTAANLVVDGRLPELSLRNPQDQSVAAKEMRTSNPFLVVALLCMSFGASALLLFIDFEPPVSSSQRQAEARREVEHYYSHERKPLEPYQVLLREAQQAHSRRDYELERQRYRDVLALLRAEGRSRFAGLTGTPKSDEELEKLLAVLLSGE